MYYFVFDQPQNNVSATSFSLKLVDRLPATITPVSPDATYHSIISNSDLDTYYMHQYTKNFPYLFTLTSLIMIVSTLLLWGWMKRREEKKHDRIAFDIRKLRDSEPQHQDEFYDELESIKEQMNAYQKDQERLHAYITHEQKNMIMMIKARLDQREDPKLMEDLDKLKHSVDDVLTLFANEESEKENVDLAILTAMECDLYRQIYPQLSFHFDEEQDYTILGKEYWIRRAIANLIDNAIKYGNQKPIEVVLSQKHNCVILKVIDHGLGMPKEQFDEIFQYRYRIHNLQKDGFGIGLSLVSHVCDLCDGVIWVDSKTNKGSIFQMSFPLNIS